MFIMMAPSIFVFDYQITENGVFCILRDLHDFFYCIKWILFTAWKKNLPALLAAMKNGLCYVHWFFTKFMVNIEWKFATDTIFLGEKWNALPNQ